MSNNQQQGHAEALIEKIQKDATEEAARILAVANEQADAITREARRKATLKVHEAVESLRDREEREMAQEAARFETERRQRRQGEEKEALAEGLTQLEAALTSLWAEKDSRELWCRNVLAVAFQRFPVKEWRLEYPSGFPLDELASLVSEILDHTDIEPECSAGNGLRAGVRIHSGTACVDGSIAAIVADQQRNSAKFLSLLLTTRQDDTS
jgi:vacuolar-type H+-ATPase subunit E/Vma4